MDPAVSPPADMPLEKQTQALTSMTALRDLAREGGLLTADGQDVDLERYSAFAFHSEWLAALPEPEQAWIGAYTRSCFSLDDRLAMEGLVSHVANLLDRTIATLAAVGYYDTSVIAAYKEATAVAALPK